MTSATRHSTASQPIGVEVLVCGSMDRGDDGAPMLAIDLVRKALPDDVRVRIVSELDIDDLLGVAPGAGVVIVDAAIGIDAGEVVELPINGFAGRPDGLRPRSSHALEFPEVVGLAEMMRGRPVDGRVVAIGGAAFGLGGALSRRVAAAMPELTATILGAIDRSRVPS